MTPCRSANLRAFLIFNNAGEEFPLKGSRSGVRLGSPEPLEKIAKNAGDRLRFYRADQPRPAIPAGAAISPSEEGRANRAGGVVCAARRYASSLHSAQPADLARWLMPSSPLTPRVAVNHLAALVRPGLGSDFGDRGYRLIGFSVGSPAVYPPSSRKEMIRLIVTSAAYRQSSRHRPAVGRRAESATAPPEPLPREAGSH